MEQGDGFRDVEKGGVKTGMYGPGLPPAPRSRGPGHPPSLHTSPGTYCGLLLQGVQGLPCTCGGRWRLSGTQRHHSSQSGPLGTPFWTDVLKPGPEKAGPRLALSHSGPRLLNRVPLTFVSDNPLWWGLSCVLKDIQEHLRSLPSGC